MSATTVFAKHIPTESIVHIDHVEQYQRKGFVCPGCYKEMIVVKSKARKKDWHFRHAVETICDGNRDTALHSYTIQLLLKANKIKLSKSFFIDYSQQRKEVTVLGKRSDVTVNFKGEDVHFEIFVKHNLSDEKIKLYNDNKIKCVKIDLSNPKYLVASSESIEQIVIHSDEGKSFVYWPLASSVVVENKGNNFLERLITMVGIAALIFFICQLFSKNRRS